MKILRPDDYRRMPWKNGGGETVEIAVSPPDAGLDDFCWRISMAIVAVEGPFSHFPGATRTLSILQGAGLRLEIEGRNAILLDMASDPLTFPADVPVHARLEDGPVVDFNVMTRDSHCRQTVERFTDGSARRFRAFRGSGLVYCQSGTASLQFDDRAIDLKQEESLLFRDDVPDFILRHDGCCHGVRIEDVHPRALDERDR